jgi:ADP-ribose pyrophosphatase YjhB (NUDIX family)
MDRRRLYKFETTRRAAIMEGHVQRHRILTTIADYQFCPRCGGRSNIACSKPEPARLVCVACDFVFYLDPKIAVGTIIRTDHDRFVLVRRAIEPGYGKWVFPGGYVDRGEPLTTAAIREAREECGLDVRLDGLVNIYSYPRRAPVIVVYAATAIGGALRCDDEGLEASLFTSDAIPWQELAFRSKEGLRDYLAGRGIRSGSSPRALRVTRQAIVTSSARYLS